MNMQLKEKMRTSNTPAETSSEGIAPLPDEEKP